MKFKFETLGNATVQVFRDDRPVLATDPWLVGTAYFGSWALELPPNERQIRNVVESEYIWISHGHPDHLHHESLDLLPRGKKFLVPDHYFPEIKDFLISRGFEVAVMPYKAWVPLGPNMRAMSLDNENQDAMLVVEAGDALVINMNDSPFCGTHGFLRRLVRAHPNDKTYLLALCAIDADMLNFVDARGNRVTPPLEEYGPGKIHEVADRAASLGVRNFCCSSSQHIYVRKDSIWANDYRVTWPDIQRHWSRPQVKVHEPFVTVDLATGGVTRNHPDQTFDESRITDRTGDDNWADRLDAGEWGKVEAFFARFDLLKPNVDCLAFTVGGETRRFDLKPGAKGKPEAALRMIRFAVPKASLLAAVEYGYFDDLLIGNFMMTETRNVRLYPAFSPVVAKLGGNAKVFTRADYRKFRWHYFARSPKEYVLGRAEALWRQAVSPAIVRLFEHIGLKHSVRRLYRTLKGVPA